MNRIALCRVNWRAVAVVSIHTFLSLLFLLSPALSLDHSLGLACRAATSWFLCLLLVSP